MELTAEERAMIEQLKTAVIAEDVAAASAIHMSSEFVALYDRILPIPDNVRDGVTGVLDNSCAIYVGRPSVANEDEFRTYIFYLNADNISATFYQAGVTYSLPDEFVAYHIEAMPYADDELTGYRLTQYSQDGKIVTTEGEFSEKENTSLQSYTDRLFYVDVENGEQLAG
jgi:hypothetical protein